jgi:hypothetical protein
MDGHSGVVLSAPCRSSDVFCECMSGQFVGGKGMNVNRRRLVIADNIETANLAVASPPRSELSRCAVTASADTFSPTKFSPIDCWDGGNRVSSPTQDHSRDQQCLGSDE